MNYEVIDSHALTAEQAQELERTFIMKVYGWMSAGLIIIGIFSLLILSSESLLQMIFQNSFVYIGIIIAQVGLVVWLSTRIQHMSAMTATMVFMGYSALTGVTLSLIFLVYTVSSLASTFFVTAGTFGAMSFYGMVTKRDLTKLGGFLMMGLIGLVLASVVNIFWHNSTVYWISTYVGVLIFVGLTAYDTQKIKSLAVMSLDGSESEQKGAIIGALRLYLDFINLFLMLLRILGKRR